MTLPPLVVYSAEDEYRTHFKSSYCVGPILTFDGFNVRFKTADFKHCFYDSSKRNGVKDAFSIKRAQRIDWIRAVLQDPTCELYEGWDKAAKRYDRSRRVSLVGDYAVIIRFVAGVNAAFITAFLSDPPGDPRRESTVEKIRKSPKW